MHPLKLRGAKTAATKIGISVEQYLQILSFELKWCFRCQSFLSRDFFTNATDTHDGKHTQCKDCENIAKRRRYKAILLKERKPRSGRRGSLPRDGDKQQARNSVRYKVRKGEWPHPQTVPCTDCGHMGDDRRHEYDHYLGYEAVNHLKVQVVCSQCHHYRERERRFSATHPLIFHR